MSNDQSKTPDPLSAIPHRRTVTPGDKPRRDDGLIAYPTFRAALKRRQKTKKATEKVRSAKNILSVPRCLMESHGTPFETGQFAHLQRTAQGSLEALAVIVVMLKHTTAGMRMLSLAQARRLLLTMTHIVEGTCWASDDMLAQVAFRILTGRHDSDDEADV